MERRTPTIAFEGINRVGKGTQIEKLQKALESTKIIPITLRGDGTRDGLGLHDGDPISPWWQEYSKKLRASGSTQEWHYAAYKLALDIASWRQQGRLLDKDLILLDRSLLSRATFVLDRERPSADILSINDLYPVQPGPKLSLEDVLPDVIIELMAPKEVVLARLDQSDPKFSFRANLISEQYDRFYSAKKRLPQEAQERIVTVDSTRPIDEVFDSIVFMLDDRIREWRKKS